MYCAKHVKLHKTSCANFAKPTNCLILRVHRGPQNSNNGGATSGFPSLDSGVSLVEIPADYECPFSSSLGIRCLEFFW